MGSNVRGEIVSRKSEESGKRGQKNAYKHSQQKLILVYSLLVYFDNSCQHSNIPSAHEKPDLAGVE